MYPTGASKGQSPFGLYDAHVDGAYDSYHLFDCTRYTFNFCEKCLRQLFNQCKIKPHIRMMDYDETFEFSDDNDIVWNDDQTSYEYRVWKDDGGHHQAYLNGKCNAEKDCANKAVYTRLMGDDFTENCFCEIHKDTRGFSNYKLVPFIRNELKSFL
jgi:hypothetical protein